VLLAFIGVHFTMDPADAALAARDTGAKSVVPIPLRDVSGADGDAGKFAKALKKSAAGEDRSNEGGGADVVLAPTEGPGRCTWAKPTRAAARRTAIRRAGHQVSAAITLLSMSIGCRRS
jgi:hypothetical protein